MTPEELEVARKAQEVAWYRAGYTRQQIQTMLRDWPLSLGYAPYEWNVGDPPDAAV
jgi:hypothetical protein